MTAGWHELDGLPEPCRAAFAAAEAANPELGLDWFANLAGHALEPGTRAAVLVAETNGATVALPVQYRRRRGLLRGLATFYTSLYAPALAGSEAAAALGALARRLRQEGWWGLRLAPMDPEGPAWGPLLAGLRAAGWRVFPFFCHGNWYLRTEGRAYEDYFRSLPSRLRNTVLRRERRLLADGRGRTEIVLGGEGLEAAIADWTRIYDASWKVPEPFPEFMPGLIRLCAGRGWLRLGLVHYDGEPVAAQVWLVSGGRAAIYKLAYDEHYADLSAGTVLTARMMRHVMDLDRVAEVDYLIGDEPYKRDWMNLRRERWGLVAYNPGRVRGLAAALREAAGRMLKRLLRVWRGALRNETTAPSPPAPPPRGGRGARQRG